MPATIFHSMLTANCPKVTAGYLESALSAVKIHSLEKLKNITEPKNTKTVRRTKKYTTTRPIHQKNATRQPWFAKSW